jgi:hypothetical protein
MFDGEALAQRDVPADPGTSMTRAEQQTCVCEITPFSGSIIKPKNIQKRVFEAMLKMKKIDIATLERAYEGR